MDIRKLSAFIKVVELGSLTRAAEHLGIAQPSLSQQIMGLEAFFKVKLLNRSKQGVAPTPAGDLLYRQAHIMLRQLDQARDELRQANSGLSGSISVGVAGSIGVVVAVPLFRELRRRYPGISARIVAASYALLGELTASARVDLAISVSAPGRGVNAELLLTDELVHVSTTPFGPDFGETISIPDLADCPLVLPMQVVTSTTVAWEAFARHGFTPNVVGEFESTYDLIRAVRDGLGSTIIGWEAARLLAPDLFVRHLKPRLERTIYLSEPEILPPSASLIAVKGVIKELVSDLVNSGQWVGATLPTPAGTRNG